MVATTSVQHEQALSRANEIRLIRSAERRRVRALPPTDGMLRVGELLVQCPDWLRSVPIHLLLLWPTRMGPIRVRKLLALAEIRDVRYVGENRASHRRGLTDRQRKLLARALGWREDGESGAVEEGLSKGEG